MDPRQIDWEEVQAKYNCLSLAEQNADDWHRHSDREIERLIRAYLHNHLEPLGTVLNAGSSGRDYGIRPERQIHADLAIRNLRSVPKSCAANIERLPLLDYSIDVCLCVGSVLNYCDAVVAIAELARCLRVGGTLVLEFESSRSLQFIGMSVFGANACIIDTFAPWGADRIWVFSERYIRSILATNHLIVRARSPFHILSPLTLRLTKSITLAARLARADSAIRHIPLAANFSANIILFCQKIA